MALGASPLFSWEQGRFPHGTCMPGPREGGCEMPVLAAHWLCPSHCWPCFLGLYSHHMPSAAPMSPGPPKADKSVRHSMAVNVVVQS